MTEQYRLALLDLDGTLWRGGEVIPGAPEFVERLRQQGVQPVFFTNNASRTPGEVVAALARCGIAAADSEICTSAQGAAYALKARVAPGALVTYIGQAGLREALLAEGFDPRRAVGADLHEAWVEKAAAAVVGIDQTVSYMDLTLICRVAYRLGWFVLTNPDVRLPVEDGFLPGNGALGALVATASGTQPVVMGKPTTEFVEFALARYQATREETVIIGDNLHTDIQAGVSAGVHSIWVKSGISQTILDGDPTPDEVVESVADLFRQ